MSEYRFTSKLPTLLIGLGLLALGFSKLGRSKQLSIVAVLCIASGAGFVYWSSSVRDWCAPDTSRLGKAVWGQLQLHEPSLRDCAVLVFGK